MKLIDDARKNGFDKKIQESKKELATGENNNPDDPYSKLVPGPYTLEFCQEFLEKLLKAQKNVRQHGPDPHMTLILDDEIHEIQRIWRIERGDWKSTAYQIYERILGERLILPHEDLGGFGAIEQNVLEEICQKNNVPTLAGLQTVKRRARIPRHDAAFQNISKDKQDTFRGMEGGHG